MVVLDVEEVDNLHLDPSFVTFDDGVESIQDEERDETEEDEEEYEVSRSVISRARSRDFPNMFRPCDTSMN